MRFSIALLIASVSCVSIGGCTAPNPCAINMCVEGEDLARGRVIKVSPDLLAAQDLLAVPDLLAAPDTVYVGPPSCMGLAVTCGSQKNENCCATTPVARGTFFRSYDGTADFSNRQNPATVSDFHLDRFEITVGRFRGFVKAVQAGWQPIRGTGAHPRITNSGWGEDAKVWSLSTDVAKNLQSEPMWPTWTNQPMNNENRPINYVNWFEAFAFCTWDGGRLPTEAEWNYAAAGGTEQRAYPWSNPPTSTAIDDTLAVYCGKSCSILDVGSKPAGDGRWKQADLAGNVWEWVFDGYGPYSNPCVDCANLVASPDRTLRGGNFAVAPGAPMSNPMRVATRPHVNPLHRDNSSGFRCARDP